MTLKQLEAEIKRTERNLEDAKRNDTEMMELRGFSAFRKDVEYYTARLEKLRNDLPKIEREEEEKAEKRKAKEQSKDRARMIEYTQRGNDLYGMTPKGKRWVAIHNWYGVTDRTRHCYSLHIEGKCLFTSGTIEAVLEAVAVG